MANQANRSKFRLAVPLLLVLLATLVTGGIALAELPASAPAGVSTTEVAGHPARGESDTLTPTPTPTPCGPPIPGTWASIAPLNTARFGMGVVYFPPTGKFYAMGGAAAGGRDIPIEEYDPAANTWTNRVHLATGVSDTGAAVVGNYIYVPGGYDGTNTRIEMQRFDPVANSVSTVAPMPSPNSAHAVVALGTRVYVLGGSATGIDGTTNYIYDTTTNSWSSGAPEPSQPLEYPAADTDGTYIYLIAGRRGAAYDLDIVQRYDPASDTWTAMPNLSTQRGAPAAFFDGYRIWAVNGGWLNHLPSTEFYVPGSAAWAAGPDTLVGTTELGAAFSDSLNMAIKAGGYISNYSADAEKLTFTAAPCPTSTRTPTATPTACPIQYTDVPVGSTFYPYIHCLACLGIINGYPDGTFRTNNHVTRGQLSKIVSNSAGFNDPQTTQMFQDAPVGSTFFQYIGRLASRGFINGYACGGAGEPCVPPANLPYFRPNANSTRGQISKIVSNAAGFAEQPTGQQFQDVLPTNVFYAYIYRLVLHNAMSGYPCDIPPAGACVPPGNLPYFLPSNNATRGQTSKIVSNTFFPDCSP